MKVGLKKIAAFLSAAAIVTTLSGCNDNGYIMEVDGMPIRTGIYISFQQTAMGKAQNKLSEIFGDEADNIEDVFTQSIDDKSFSDWVKEDTAKSIKRFVGIQRQCDKYDITLSDDEKTDINKEVQTNWDSTGINYFGYTFSIQDMYGYETMGKYYESQGIGIDSLKEISYVSALSDKLFWKFYSEDGEYAVPDEEIDEYLEDNSVAYKMIEIQYVDYAGLPVAGEEQEEIIELAKSYAEKYNDGADFVDILYDYDLYCAQNDARYAAEQEYEENPPEDEDISLEEYVEEAVSEASATKYDDDDSFDEIVFNYEIESEEFADFILEAPADGTAAAYEGETAVYVIIRNPVSNFPEWKENNLEDVITELRTEEYDSKMEELSRDYSVVQKDSLVNGKYSPEKLNK